MIHDYFKNVTSGVFTRFSFDLAGDLIFDSKWPSFKVNLKNIKANNLRMIYDDCLKNVTSRVLQGLPLI